MKNTCLNGPFGRKRHDRPPPDGNILRTSATLGVDPIDDGRSAFVAGIGERQTADTGIHGPLHQDAAFIVFLRTLLRLGRCAPFCSCALVAWRVGDDAGMTGPPKGEVRGRPGGKRQGAIDRGIGTGAFALDMDQAARSAGIDQLLASGRCHQPRTGQFGLGRSRCLPPDYQTGEEDHSGTCQERDFKHKNSITGKS